MLKFVKSKNLMLEQTANMIHGQNLDALAILSTQKSDKIWFNSILENIKGSVSNTDVFYHRQLKVCLK